MALRTRSNRARSTSVATYTHALARLLAPPKLLVQGRAQINSNVVSAPGPLPTRRQRQSVQHHASARTHLCRTNWVIHEPIEPALDEFGHDLLHATFPELLVLLHVEHRTHTAHAEVDNGGGVRLRLCALACEFVHVHVYARW